MNDGGRYAKNLLNREGLRSVITSKPT